VPFLLRGIHIKFSPLANEFQYAVVPVGNFILLIALFPYVDGCESSGHNGGILFMASIEEKPINCQTN